MDTLKTNMKTEFDEETMSINREGCVEHIWITDKMPALPNDVFEDKKFEPEIKPECDYCSSDIDENGIDPLNDGNEENISTPIDERAGNESAYNGELFAKKEKKPKRYQKKVKLRIGNELLGCRECGRKLATPSEFIVHFRTHKYPSNIKCPVCLKEFPRKSTLNRHVKTHSDSRPYECDVCTKKFQRSDYLKTHLHTHTGGKPFQCDRCGRSFNQVSSLRAHMRICSIKKHRRISEISDICEKKLYPFNLLHDERDGNASSNVDSEKDTNPLECRRECGRNFFSISEIISHFQTHKKDRNFECPVCKMTFQEMSLLMQHVKKYDDNRPCVCYVCNKKFHFKNNLRKKSNDDT